MCGIAGFLETSQANYDLSAIANAMANALKHRGPDSYGVWVDKGANCSVGLSHSRLSILDLSEAGHQPMLSETGRYVISYNGEIYNHSELRQQLLVAHHFVNWRGESDTETILACIDYWGLEPTLKKLKGMFAFALWDREESQLYLCRDRIGEKPLYYGWQSDTFFFASELRALKKHPRFRANISANSVQALTTFNYVPAPNSIYQNIYKLLPGHFLEVEIARKDVRQKSFWSLSEINTDNEPMEYSQAVDELEKVFLATVKRQLISDVPIGALLSGGIDSTLICSLMQSVSSDTVKTFTIGFEEEFYNEADQARKIADHLKTDHSELYVSAQDCLDLVPDIPGIYDEPFADSSQLPTALVMKLAKSKVSVALSGDGGDELFGGYTRYRQVPNIWKKVGFMPNGFRNLTGKLMTALPANTLNKLGATSLGHVQWGDKLHRLGQRIHNINSADDLYFSLVREWNEMSPMLADNKAVLRTGMPNMEKTADRMMYVDTLTYLPDDILVKVDRAAMHSSLETRAPFLDLDIIEYAWKLPLQYKIDQKTGKGKKVLTDLMARYVPNTITDRPKQGFAVPLDMWLRGPLSEWANELLAHNKLEQSGFFNVEVVRKAWQLHYSGKANYGYRLWSVLMFQAWLEQE